jgi:hypothetical protein
LSSISKRLFFNVWLAIIFDWRLPMRRMQFLILIPALLALFGTSRTATAGNTLNVSPNCFNLGGYVAACSPYTTGGTGNYVSYYWQFTDTYTYPGQPPSTYTYSWTSTDPWMQQNCRGYVTVTLTVTDSQGETGTGTHSIICSGAPD